MAESRWLTVGHLQAEIQLPINMALYLDQKYLPLLQAILVVLCNTIEHYLKACAEKTDCTEIVTVSTDDHSLVDHLVWWNGSTFIPFRPLRISNGIALKYFWSEYNAIITLSGIMYIYSCKLDFIMVVFQDLNGNSFWKLHKDVDVISCSLGITSKVNIFNP